MSDVHSCSGRFLGGVRRVCVLGFAAHAGALWLYATLMLSDRVWGYVIMLFGGLIATGMIVVHSPGTVVNKSGGFFFVWTLFILSTTGLFTAILSARALWKVLRSRRGMRARSREQKP